MEPSTVLVIDDDIHHRDIIVTILRHHGYELLEADNGERGVQLALEQQPRVILMDVQLPVLDGWAATERLKRDDRTAAIPIIIYTAHALEQDRLKSASAGADSYLAKPCDPRHILAEVQRWIGPARRSDPVRSSPEE